MRFKNLTITLTLTCLSIVALAGLVLLPVTNGICEWTGNERLKSYTNSSVDIEQESQSDYNNWSKDTQMGRGWFLNASLSSGESTASASVFPSIYGLSSFILAEVAAGAGTYGGTANVRAYREDGWLWCDICQDSYFLKGEEKSNKDQERTLTAKVESEKWYKIDGIEIDTQTGHDVTAGASAKTEVSVIAFDAEVEAHGSYTWTRSDGKKFREETKREFYKLKEGTPTSQSRDISTHSLTNGAALDFNFSGHSGSNSVKWSCPGPGSGVGQGSGSD